MKDTLMKILLGLFFFAGVSGHAAFGAEADDRSDAERVLSCKLVSVSMTPGSDITVFKRKDFEKQDCPANFRVKDGEGNDYLLSAVIRAIPSVPANSPCGSELNALVGYDIDKGGETVNVEAISGAPEKWVKRSRKAVDAMKFEPYLVDGEPIDIKGIEMSFKGSMACPRFCGQSVKLTPSFPRMQSG